MTASQKPVIGIDLGGTNMQIGLVDARQSIISRTKAKTRADEGAERVLKRLADRVHEVMDAGNVSIEEVGAVGIAAAGAIDIPNGVVLDAPNLGWKSFPLREQLARLIKTHIVVENDVNAAAWGEYVLGPAKKSGDVFGIWVGTGIGGGLVLDGKLYHGDCFTAGEIGLTTFDFRGKKKRRKLEHIASRTGMSRSIMARLQDYPKSIMHDIIGDRDGIKGSKMLAQGYGANDPLMVEVIHEAADVIGCAIANVVTLLSIDMVIVGGGVTEALGTRFLDRIISSFKQEVFPDERQTCRLIATELADDAGLLGAALLARDALSQSS